VTWKLAKERALGDVMSSKWLTARSGSNRDPAPAALPPAKRQSSVRLPSPLLKSRAASTNDATAKLPTRVSGPRGASASRAALFKAAQDFSRKDD
jgi:hypothetical protein